jgi:4-amino-4-deoxy-L-arabinose transferase-like glycosyltransferase
VPIPSLLRPSFAPSMLLVLLLAFAYVMPFQGTRHLWGTDEGRYSAVAVEMLDSGNWLMPHRHPDHPHYSKPPLTYWVLASSMAVFGKNEWALRLPSALAFALTIGCAFASGKRLQPERPWWPPLLVAGTAMIFLAANAVSTDPLLLAFETLGMTGVILAWRGESERVARDGALLVALGFGLAFLTKGPPGLIPLLPTLWFWWRNRAEFRANPFSWKILALFALIALPWFIAVIVLYPELKLLGYFLGYETYGRIFTDVADRHPQWYGWIMAYGPVALVGALPWTVVLAWDAIRRRGQPRPPISADDRAVLRFLLLWLLVPLLVFVLARSRLTLYVLPLLVPFALWAAQRTRHLAVTRTGKILLALWFALLLAGKAGIAYTHYGKDASVLADTIRAQVHERIDEVVFVDETALYGVRVYLNVPVLRVDYGETANTAVDDTLEHALAQHRSHRLWLVHQHTAAQFASDVARTGAHALPVTRFAHYQAFLVDDPKAAKPASAIR